MKLNMFVKNFFLIVAIFLFFIPVHSEEKKISVNEHKFNFYSGMFDFSDDGKSSRSEEHTSELQSQ